MITLSSPKTLSPFSFLCNPIPKPQIQNPKFAAVTQYSDSNSKPTLDSDCESVFQTERGLKFDVGGTFFRHESATGRDLGVLAAALYKKSKGKLRVLDALCGCGIRSLRYLVEAEADFVLANDANDENKKVITENLSQVESGSGDEARWEVSLTDANRIMTECYLKRDFFDLIDIDSFGSDSSFLRSAFNALKLNGLLYVTSTDGFSSGGRRPQQHYGFISYCNGCGSSQEYSWAELGRIGCPCSDSKVSKSLVVSGPLWTGPLHDTAYITEMLSLAEEWGWAGIETGTDLDKLLNQMVAESDPRLPFGYTKLDEVASRAKVNSPSLRAVMSTLQKEGYAVSRSHIESNAIKTNCPMEDCIRIAKQLQQR